MSSYNPFNYYSKEENLLIEQYLVRREALTIRHNTEVFDSETSNASAYSKVQMQLRQTSELIHLTQLHFNLWIDLLEEQKLTLSRLL
jgi:hypothetical protein